MSTERDKEEESEASTSKDQEDVRSSAVVKFSAVSRPTQYAELQQNTDLNIPPESYMRHANIRQFMRRHVIVMERPISSVIMANHFPDSVGNVDVISGAETIKTVLKIPYSRDMVSLIAHRVGSTLLLDKFDVCSPQVAMPNDYYPFKLLQELCIQLARKAEARNPKREKKDRDSLLRKGMLSKFLHMSLEMAPEEELRGTDQPVSTLTNQFASFSFDDLPDESGRKTPAGDNVDMGFQRNFLWKFEDIQMLIGTNIPIFGGGTRPCITLRLRDMREPISILTGLDYWLDNLMCNVPEVVMCFHVDGFVQKYESFKTEDLPNIEKCQFSPFVIKDVAQNILSFLKSNATKEGHTYWLFKGQNDDVVKLYDLTTLMAESEGPSSDTEANPFTIPVAILMFNVARNMRKQGDEIKKPKTILKLLEHCIKLLKDQHLEVVYMAHYMLSDMYIPSSVDLTAPRLINLSNDEKEEEGSPVKKVPTKVTATKTVRLECYRDVTEDLESAEKTGPTANTVEERCFAAFDHVAQGLNCIHRGEEKSKKEEKVNQAIPNQAIPMHYFSLSDPSPTKDSNIKVFENLPPSVTRLNYNKCLLIEKAMTCSVLLADNYSDDLNKSMKYIKLALLCYECLVEIYSNMGKKYENRSLHSLTQALILAGDSHFLMVSSNLSEVSFEWTQCEEDIRENIRPHLPKELKYSWVYEIADSVEDKLQLSLKCYKSAKATKLSDKSSLSRKIGNICHEIASYFINLIIMLLNDKGSQRLKIVKDLCAKSEEYFKESLSCFTSINDKKNIAVVYSSKGRLMRIVSLFPGYDLKQKVQEACSNYELCLNTIGRRTEFPALWDSVYWDISTTWYNAAVLMTEVNGPKQEIIEVLHHSAKYCHEKNEDGTLDTMKVTRAAAIYQRLAEIYYQFYVESKGNKQRFKLTSNNYIQASSRYRSTNNYDCYLTVQTDLFDLHVSQIKFSTVSKVKTIASALQCFVDAKSVIESAGKTESFEKVCSDAVCKIRYNLEQVSKSDIAKNVWIKELLALIEESSPGPYSSKLTALINAALPIVNKFYKS